MTKMILTEIIASFGKPTLFFLVTPENLILLDKGSPKRLHYSALDSFKIHTTELIKYEN